MLYTKTQAFSLALSLALCPSSQASSFSRICNYDQK
ncbi:hypothetical protein A2U01_0097381, partial [Trifolium medium]|nr:hypothetical protein [Trifolium medium]